MNCASRRPGFGVAIAVLGLLLVGAATTGGWYAVKVSKEQRARDGAAILAEHALREFAAATTALELLDLEVGADSIVTRRRLMAGDETTGMYVVQIGRTGDTHFHVKSTGRLVSTGAPFVCSYDVDWKLEQQVDPRRALAPDEGPICNGSRRRRPSNPAAAWPKSQER